MTEFPKHFDGKKFFNPNAPQARGPFDAMKWKLKTRPEPSRFMDDVQPTKPPANPPDNDSQIRVTLINHSTVLLQQAGLNILTDPIWSERASPFAWIGPKRLRQPGVRWDDLPRIDIALISHNHYDHLDLATLRRLAKRDAPRFIVPIRCYSRSHAGGISLTAANSSACGRFGDLERPRSRQAVVIKTVRRCDDASKLRSSPRRREPSNGNRLCEGPATPGWP